MTEIKTERAQTHIRVHNREGFVMGLDINVPYTDVINLLTDYMAKHGEADSDEAAYCEGCGEIIDGDKGLMCSDCIQGDIKTLNDRMSDLEAKVATVDNQRAAHARVLQNHIRETEYYLTEEESHEIGHQIGEEEEIALFRLKHDGTI